MTPRTRRTSLLLTLAALVVGWPAAALAQISYSPDVTVSLSGTVVADEDAAVDDLAGTVGLADLGTLPAAT